MTQRPAKLNLAAIAGYTLIELVVVMALISIMFFFAMPRFQDSVLTDQFRKTSRWVLTQTRHIRQQAVREKKDYVLHVDIDAEKLWVSTLDMEAEALQKAEEGAFQLSEDVEIMDVEFLKRGKLSSGQADIYFYAKGYSDKVLIHMQENHDRQVSFLIEPFLPQTKYLEGYSEFGD